MWIFVWLLLTAGSQFSAPYDTQAACESARTHVAETHVSPEGHPVERTFPCVRLP